MVRRLGGTYRSTNRPLLLRPRPIIAAAVEGETEFNYLRGLSVERAFWVNFEPKIFPGFHRRPLVDKAIDHAKRYGGRGSGVEVIPIAVFDTEMTSDEALEQTLDAVAYGASKGVYVFVNLPVVERWLLLHHRTVPIHTSPREINRLLAQAHGNEGLPLYAKPGTPQLFSTLANLRSAAIDNCSATGHLTYGDTPIPCMCRLMELLGSFNREAD